MPTYRSDNRNITIDGETKTITQWSQKTGVPRKTIDIRLKRGWPPDQAVYFETRRYTKPARNNGSSEEVQAEDVQTNRPQ